jgi:predicted lysophospholipase L1 biosynthesis ABC-type transport system permease subunit
MLIRPLAQQPASTVTLAVHTAIDPLQLAKPVQQAVQRLDADLPVFNVRTLEEHVAQSPLGLMPLRFGALVAAIQGALVLVLAVMGLYGLVSFAVACRTREIGIRMALGASRGEILRLVSRPSLVLTGVGLAIGLALALLLSQPLRGLLYGASPNLPVVFILVGLLISVVTLAAAWLPARRAARIDPVEALRAE